MVAERQAKPMAENERPHTHNYRQQRQVVERGNVYTFWLCSVSGCPEPHKMTIDKQRQGKWPKGGKRRGFRG